MSDKLEALSQPVGYFIEWQDAETGEKEWCECSKQNGAPLYSQEYVTTLQSALKLEQEQSAYYEQHMWHFHGLAESEIKRAEAAEQRLELVREQRDNELHTNAELERRLQQPALADVIAERQRQISAEGWTPEHDDEHDNNELAFAAGCYAIYAGVAKARFPNGEYAPPEWPWNASFWKPSTVRRDLVKAGALILAEIERLDRMAVKVEELIEMADQIEEFCPRRAATYRELAVLRGEQPAPSASDCATLNVDRETYGKVLRVVENDDDQD